MFKSHAYSGISMNDGVVLMGGMTGIAIPWLSVENAILQCKSLGLSMLLLQFARA